jgi:hypothetical protein
LIKGFVGRVHSLVERPVLSGSGNPEEDAHILPQPGKPLSWTNYSFLFDEEFEVGLYYLPYAMQDSASRVKSYWELSCRMARWVSMYAESLGGLGLLDDTLDCMREVFWGWLEVIRVAGEEDLAQQPAKWRLSCVLEENEARDEYLSSMISREGPVRECAEGILNEWGHGPVVPARSVHFLDMCAMAAGGNTIPILSEALYASPCVRTYLKDESLLRTHLETAAVEWRKKGFPEWYGKEVERLLRL